MCMGWESLPSAEAEKQEPPLGRALARSPMGRSSRPLAAKFSFDKSHTRYLFVNLLLLLISGEDGRRTGVVSKSRILFCVQLPICAGLIELNIQFSFSSSIKI